jgi:hypothetical protein
MLLVLLAGLPVQCLNLLSERGYEQFNARHLDAVIHSHTCSARLYPGQLLGNRGSKHFLFQE